MNHFNIPGMRLPTVLMPAKDIDLAKWSVVACDQYTSEPEYWKAVEQIVGSSPSTLRLILPECNLESANTTSQIETIHHTMESYLREGVLEEQEPAIRFVKRGIPGKPTRNGLLVLVDLECYDFSEGSKSLVRPTEGTIVDRLPARIQIRKEAIFLHFRHSQHLFPEQSEMRTLQGLQLQLR